MVVTSTQRASVGASPREKWVDNVRVLVIAGVIVVHTATGYVSDLAGWYYDDERVAGGVWSVVLTPVAGFGALFALGPLFLLAGWFSVRSIARRGPAGYARARLVRLGIPLLVFLALVEPVTDYLGNIRSESHGVAHYLATTEVSVLWFAAAVLTTSLGFAAWERVGRRRRPPVPLSWRVVALAAGIVAVSSFVVWLVLPLNREMFLNLRIAQWPQGVVLFALGVMAARAGWMEDPDRHFIHGLGVLTLAGTLALFAFLGVQFATGAEEVVTRGDWPTVLFAVLYGIVAVGFTLWFVAFAQRRWRGHGPLIGTASRASYATYFLHPLALTALMVAFAAVPLGPAVKFVVVSALAVPICFGAGYALTRLPGASRIF
jgi:surface polysaccharide O-acyltransferase-like enzyme